MWQVHLLPTPPWEHQKLLGQWTTMVMYLLGQLGQQTGSLTNEMPWLTEVSGPEPWMTTAQIQPGCKWSPLETPIERVLLGLVGQQLRTLCCLRKFPQGVRCLALLVSNYIFRVPLRVLAFSESVNVHSESSFWSFGIFLLESESAV